jgi:hypothetical protein
LALVGRLLPHQHPQQRRLAGAVGPDDPDDPAGWQLEIDVLKNHPVAIRLAQVHRVDHAVAQSLAGRNLDF